MVDCIFEALKLHIQYLGLPVHPKIRTIYDLVRIGSGHEKGEDTFAGVVPYMATLVSCMYNLHCIVEQNQEFDLMAQASELERRFMFGKSPNAVTGGMGIYCGYYSTHAMFWPHPQTPIGDLWVLSIKLRIKEN